MSLRTAARRSLAAAAILVASAGAAGAQYSGAVTYHGPTTNATSFNNRYYVGPITETIQLTGTAPGQAITYTAFCVDVANSISIGTKYTANVTSLGQVLAGTTTLGNTRQGTDKSDLLGYKKAAFLIDQFDGMKALTGAERNQTWGALQGALWAIFTPSSLTLDASTSTSDQQVIEYWHEKANVFAASAAFNTYDYSRFYIVTDVRARGTATGGVQEFMASTGPATVTPEPASVLLLGAGLAATFGAVARRRRALSA